jgi:DNA-binding IclR family transcriptional regulator
MAHIPAERCLSIVQLLVENPVGMALGQIAQRLALSKSGVHRLLVALIEQGWAEQDPQNGSYRLTMRLTILGQRHYMATGIPDICQPLLDALAARTHEFIRLAVIDAHALVWVADAQGARGGLMYQPLLTSNTVPLHATASGKSWLAHLPKRNVMAIVGRNGGFGEAGQFGPNAVRTFDELFLELDRTRGRGFGIAVNEAEPGVSAVAAVVFSGLKGVPAGTISVAGPGVRMTELKLEEIGRLVIQAARQLSELWPLRKQLKSAKRSVAA